MEAETWRSRLPPSPSSGAYNREESEAGASTPGIYPNPHHGFLPDCSPIQNLACLRHRHAGLAHQQVSSTSNLFSLHRIHPRGGGAHSLNSKRCLVVARKLRLCLSGNTASSVHPRRRPGNHRSAASLSEHGCDDKGSTTTWKRVCSSKRQPSKIIPRCAPSGALL